MRRSRVNWRLRLKSLIASCFVPGSAPRLLLTFDDGPHPDCTPAVLAALRRYGAKAAFFVVGSRIPRAPHMLKQVAGEGHLVGNHSFAHPLDEQFGLRDYRSDLIRCQEAVEQHTGSRPGLFRPPLGHLSAASVIAPRLLGLRSMLWSIDSEDWTLRSRDALPAMAERLVTGLSSPRANHIVLFHDDNPFTAELLDLVLPELVSRKMDLRSGVDAFR